MGNGDNRQGGDRWQDRGEGGRWERERSTFGDWGSERGRGGNRGQQQQGDDRGFFERAGEQVRSWLGDDDDRGRNYERARHEQNFEGGRGGQSFGGGFGNQRGWGDDHFDRQFGPGGQSEGRESYGGGRTSFPGGGGQQQAGGYDPHYSEWRQRQIEQLDRDYHDYRREHQSRFEQDFGGWREKRQTQRQSLGKVTEHMEVFGSDGERIGTVDKVRGDRIILTKNDPNAGGIHHLIPCSWIESVEDRVTVNKTSAEAMKQWESEEQNRALFERGDEGSEGPHMLNRSFSGTYSDDDK